MASDLDRLRDQINSLSHAVGHLMIAVDLLAGATQGTGYGDDDKLTDIGRRLRDAVREVSNSLNEVGKVPK